MQIPFTRFPYPEKDDDDAFNLLMRKIEDYAEEPTADKQRTVRQHVRHLINKAYPKEEG